MALTIKLHHVLSFGVIFDDEEFIEIHEQDLPAFLKRWDLYEENMPDFMKEYLTNAYQH